jgi:hypothetical protein
MDNPSKWEDYLHLVDFTYNNGHQASLKIVEVLHTHLGFIFPMFICHYPVS